MKLKMLAQQREQIFRVNLCNSSLQNLKIMKVTRNCYHVRNTDLHLKLTDLDPNRGIIIVFILPLTGKVRRNKNIFFQISISKFEANQLFPVLRF